MVSKITLIKEFVSMSAKRRITTLAHPSSPDESVVVARNLWQRILLPVETATIGEVSFYHNFIDAHDALRSEFTDVPYGSD